MPVETSAADTVADTIAAEVVIAALHRVLASEPFRSAQRTRAFLAYVVTETLAGRGDRIKERTVARAALGRPADFDSRLDSATRVQAGRVRRALERYYLTEGASDVVLIYLPAGSYVPTFTRRDVAEAASPGPAGAAGAGPQPGRGPDPAVPGIVADVLVAPFTSSDLDRATALGLAESLITELARFPGLRVGGPAEAPGESDRDLFDAALRFGARYLLQGTMRAWGSARRVSVRLSEVANRRLVWSEAYDREEAHFTGFAGEDDVVRRIAGALGDFGGALQRDSPTGAAVYPQVYQATLTFYRFVEEDTPAMWEQARHALLAALEPDPGNATLLAMLASCHVFGAMNRLLDPTSALPAGEELARRAIASDATNAHAHVVLAMVALAHQQPDQARRMAARAAELAPYHPSSLYAAGLLLTLSGDWDGGIALLRDLTQLNPRHAGRQRMYLAIDSLLQGDDAAALAEARLIHLPSVIWGPLLRGLALFGLGYLDDAWQEMAAVEAVAARFWTRYADLLAQAWDLAPSARAELLTRLDAMRDAPATNFAPDQD